MFYPLKTKLDGMIRDDRSVAVFFRDDDAGRWRESLDPMIDMFTARQIPLNLAVVPAWISPEDANHFVDMKKKQPELLCFYQHGFSHINHAISGKRSEFPFSRTYENQLKDLREGMEILKKELGKAFFPAFTPPWNRCSMPTLKALSFLKFKVFSSDTSTQGVSERGIEDIPVTLDVLKRSTSGEWRWREPDDIARDLAGQIDSQNRVGIMLHHRHINFDLLSEMLNVLCCHPAVRFLSFESMRPQESR